MQYLWLGYPVLVHAAVITQSHSLEAASLAMLLALGLAPALRRRRPWAYGLLSLGLIGSWFSSQSGLGMYFLYLPPILINSFLCLLFAYSLGDGRVALISRVATLIRRQELPPELAIYTRKLTAFWAVLFATLALASLVFAAMAPTAYWSLFTNFISYGIVTSVFIVEFFVRRLLHPESDHTSVRDYLRGLLSTDFRRL